MTNDQKNEKRVVIRACPPIDQEFSRKAPPPPMIVSGEMMKPLENGLRGLFSIPHEEVMAFLKRFNIRYPKFQLWNSKPSEVMRGKD